MGKAGVDISKQISKHVNSLQNITFDAVITVCNKARESCPFFPGAKKVLHVGFDDPPAMAKSLAALGRSQEEQRNCYGRVRDEIRAFIETLPDSLKGEKETE
jgi:arsenate reductase (thioredoxin)